MASVSMSRVVDGDSDAVTAAMRDVVPFMRAAGFDEVSRDGETLRVANQVGPVRIALTLALVDDPDSVLAYEQEAGIFDTMTTRYAVTEVDDGVRVEATTTFALGAAVVGSALDATVIKRQRRRELSAQLDYLESAT